MACACPPVIYACGRRRTSWDAPNARCSVEFKTENSAKSRLACATGRSCAQTLSVFLRGGLNDTVRVLSEVRRVFNRCDRPDRFGRARDRINLDLSIVSQQVIESS